MKKYGFCTLGASGTAFGLPGKWPVAKSISYENGINWSKINRKNLHFSPCWTNRGKTVRDTPHFLSFLGCFWSSRGIARPGMNRLCGILAISHLGMNRLCGKWTISAPKKHLSSKIHTLWKDLSISLETGIHFWLKRIKYIFFVTFGSSGS